MRVQPTATLCVTEMHSSWRWELAAEDAGDPVQNIMVPEFAESELLDELAQVDRVHQASDYPYAVAARNAVVERLLNSTWCKLVAPLAQHLDGAPSVSVRLPFKLIRLPIATARCARSGESLVDVSDVSIRALGSPYRPRFDVEDEPALQRPPLPGLDRPHRWYADTRIHRFDGHPEDIQPLLADVTVGSADTVLLMGCRTADLLPRIHGKSGCTAIVSLWDVADHDCGPMGDALVDAMANSLAPSEALRCVQALRSHHPPFQWAGYAAVEYEVQRPSPCATPALAAR